MSEDEKDREKHVFEVASNAGFDMRPYSVVTELKRVLASLADHGTSMDSGTGSRSADLWLTIGGVEYFLTVRPSNNQLIKEGVRPEDLPS